MQDAPRPLATPTEASRPQGFAITVPLDLGGTGPTVVVKECIAIAGHPTRSGSEALAGAPISPDHAAVVLSVLEAGCRIVGRANMHELAFGMTGVNRYLGTPVNPRWPDRIPGGSSSGSAVAVAAGLCDFAIGTDTGGSIRQPACCCGVYGFKPTFGRVSRAGAEPAESSLDCIGPFAASATMLTRAMSAMDRTFTAQHLSRPPVLKRVRTGIVDPAIEAAMDVALAAAGLTPEEIELEGLSAAYDAAITVINRETANAFGDLARSAAPMGEDVRNRILNAANTTDGALANAEAVRATFTAAVDTALAGVDALILPTMPVVPPTLAEAQDPAAVLPLTRLIRPFNLSGHPALTAPLITAQNLPAGFQLIGAKGMDTLLCAIAEWFEDRIEGRNTEKVIE